jgi:D-3-phosphoglycerate dehydrogenase
MKVIACDPYLDEETVSARGAIKVSLDELLRRADFVSINCPLDQDTRGMIGARELALMQPHAFLINTARGFIHDERALADALRAKAIAGAGIDVWDKEPPPPDHPLLQLENVIASPHIAGVTHQARANMGRIAAEQLIMTLDGQRPPRVVNPQAWRAYASRFEQAFGFCPQDCG